MLDPGYRDIVAAVDAEFARNRRLHGERMRCSAGCTDCCHHRFLITSIEAAAVAEGVRSLDSEARRAVLERAREYERTAASAARIACPALQDGVCAIYNHRPLICRKFGMPIYNPDRPERIFACELNFRAGEEIVDPDLIRIQTEIGAAWKALQAASGERVQRVTVARAILDALEDVQRQPCNSFE